MPLPCASSDWTAYRWIAVTIGGAFGAMCRFMIGNLVLAWKNRRTAAADAAVAAAATETIASTHLISLHTHPSPTLHHSTVVALIWPYPLATFLCNTIGAGLLGLLFGLFLIGEEHVQRSWMERVEETNNLNGAHQNDTASPSTLSPSTSMSASLAGGLCGPIRALLIPGFLGAFTTMSSFALESINFYHNNMKKQMIIYIFITNLVAFIFAFVGFALTRVGQSASQFSMHTHIT